VPTRDIAGLERDGGAAFCFGARMINIKASCCPPPATRHRDGLFSISCTDRVRFNRGENITLGENRRLARLDSIAFDLLVQRLKQAKIDSL
jgi:hypothetical protein